MLESVFIRIVVTMIFPFIATAFMTDRTLHRRFPRELTMLMWLVSFVAAFGSCHLIIDHLYGLSDTPILGQIYTRSVQITTIVCISAFTVLWTAVTCIAYRGTASSRVMTSLIYATLCLTSYIGIQLVFEAAELDSYVVDSLTETTAIHGILTALIYIPLVWDLPRRMSLMISRTEGRMTAYLPIPAIIFAMFTIDSYLLIYDNHYTIRDVYVAFALVVMCVMCMYLLFGRMDGSINIDRYRRELDAASIVQSSSLPDRSVMESVAGISVHATMEPAKEVAGDFYDVLPLEDGTSAVLVADVSDKGIPAAMFMMRARTVLEDGLRSGLSPAECLDAANTGLMRGNASCMFVTVLVARISGDLMEFACAGHPSPLLLRGGEVSEIPTGRGPMLGLMPGTYRNTEFRIGPHDTVLLYTDGATDAENRKGDLFGLDRLRSSFARADPDDVTCSIAEDIRSFSSGTDRADDTTLLSVSLR